MKKILFLSLIFVSPNLESNSNKALKYGVIGAGIGIVSYAVYKIFFKQVPTQELMLETENQIKSAYNTHSEIFEILGSEINYLNNENLLILTLKCLNNNGITSINNFIWQTENLTNTLTKNIKDLEKRTYKDKNLNSLEIQKINKLIKQGKSLIFELKNLNAFVETNKNYFKLSILEKELRKKYFENLDKHNIKLKKYIKQIAYKNFSKSSYPLLSLEKELQKDINQLKNQKINFGSKLIFIKNDLINKLETVKTELIYLKEYRHEKEKYELMLKIDKLESKIRQTQNDVNMGRFENFVYSLDNRPYKTTININ